MPTATATDCATLGDLHYCVDLPEGYEASEQAWRRYPVIYELAAKRPGNDRAIYVFVESKAGSNIEAEPLAELVVFVDSTYRTIPTKEGRALTGATSASGTSPPTTAAWDASRFCSFLSASSAGPSDLELHSSRCGWNHLPARYAFEPGSSIDETRRQHLALPDPSKEVWWAQDGEDMLWNNKNLHQIVPSVNVYRDGPVRELERRPLDKIAQYPVKTPSGVLPYQDFLDSDHSSTMGVVIVHKGKIVFEHYPRMEPYEKPIWWSVSKVFVSTVVAILEDRGLVDVGQPVERYVAELIGSDFEGITVRNILDMASGVDCPDGDYSDRTTCYYQFEASLGDAVRGATTPDNPYDMLAKLGVGRWAKQGTGFDYSGVNTFVLGWLVEKVTGMPFQDVVTRELWSRIGAEGDASIYAGRYGIPLVSGGVLARPRDMARFGLLFTPSYSVVSDAPLVSQRFVALLKDGGRPELLRNARYGSALRPDVKHNVYQWDLVFKNNDIYKGGWAGQGLLVNPDRDLVAVWVGYSKDAANREMAALPVLRELLEATFGNESSGE